MVRQQPTASAPEERNAVPETVPAYSNDGVDLTLIRWMLSLSPEERLQALQDAVRSLTRLQDAKPLAGSVARR